jgi:hypothetical protein
MATILYIGNHTQILETVLRLINAQEGWIGLGAADEAQAMVVFEENDIDLVLLGCGLDPEIEENLAALFEEKKPGIPVVQHYGGGSGLLYSEILLALQKK